MTVTSELERYAPGEAIPLDAIPLLDFDPFRLTLLDQVADGGRVVALFGQPQDDGRVRLTAVVAFKQWGNLAVFACEVGDSYRSLTPDCPQVHWFEREIAEQWGVVPQGHPWFKPIRFHHSYRPGHDAWSRTVGDKILPCVTDFFRVEGQEVHEVAVGPIHAGVIEPGHFRFQCAGEVVFHLEISLGYQHRGVERGMLAGPHKRAIHYMETLAGDTSIGHATAYCQALEALSGQEAPPRAQALRAICLELERLANHTGDLGALAMDAGYLPTSAYCGRLRGDFLNATAAICGSRFGRSMVRPGGVMFDLEQEQIKTLCGRLEPALRDVGGAVKLSWETLTVQTRFEDIGTVSQQTAEDLGLVGMAARASGVDCDIRRDFPTGMYRFAQIPVSTGLTGDVFARAFVRWLEVQRSGEFVLKALQQLPEGPIRNESGPLAPHRLVVSLIEGWRGEICHVAVTDAGGKFQHYKVVDPSFHNWVGLMMALRNQQISDFPLCNKSFNLSYCGHDL
jgi:Ni,Fe-hydrogenase III large subunit